jgi:predicted ATPase/DNA-binding CsgD family transcriptional regulator
MRLRVSGEHEFVVSPLRLVESDEHVTLEAVMAADAVRLFVARAEAVREDFALTLKNAAAIAQICTRLDGLPLAVELAAAWVKMLSPQELLARLERRLPLLTGGGRDLPAHQQTMRDTIAWSHDLLSAEEQVLFRRLAIFSGGSTLDAAQAVAATPGSSDTDVLRGIASLIDKSLLQRHERSHGEARFSMLETVREFGLEQLGSAGEATIIADRHADYFLGLVERIAHAGYSFFWAPHYRATTETLDAIVGIRQIAQEHDNVRVALDCLIERGRAESFLRLTTACGMFWQSRGHLHEAKTRLDSALVVADQAPLPVQAYALQMAGNIALSMGNLDVTAARAGEALTIWRTLGNPYGQASALQLLALVEENHLNWQAATELFEKTLALWRQLDEPIMVGSTLALLGGIAYGQGDFDRAIALEEEAFNLYEAMGDQVGSAMTVWYRGLIAAARGQVLEAARHYRSFFAALAEIDDAEWVFKPLVGLAAVAAQCQQFESSARLLGAVDRMLLRSGGHLFPFDQPAYEQADDAARAALGEERFADVHRDGGDLALEALLIEADAVVAAAEDAARESRQRGVGTSTGLTAREGEVLSLLAAGKTDREIAELLFISRRTANAHVANILGQFEVHSRHDAVARARELGLLPDMADTRRYT